MQVYFKLIVSFLFIFTKLYAQQTEIDRLIQSELKMTFPSIYFKHKSTDYAAMPYTIDSCFKYIALRINDINDLVMWRDTLETEQLTKNRIKKIMNALSKYIPTRSIYIESMGSEQKISRRTIEMSSNNQQIQYLLSLNSVFDITKTRNSNLNKGSKGNHLLYPKIWCWSCWKNGFHVKYRMNMRKSRRLSEKGNSSIKRK